MKNMMGGLLRQAQKMQEDMQKAQENLGNQEMEGRSGGGLVKILVDGHFAVKRVTLDDSLLADDKEMLEDLIAAAFNDAVNKMQEANKDNMSKLTAGIDLPPGFKLPF